MLFEANKAIILASKSPRRQQFLRELGLFYYRVEDWQKKVENFEHRIENYGIFAKDDQEERPQEGESPESYVERMALSKAFESLGELKYLAFEGKKHLKENSFIKDYLTKNCLTENYSLEKASTRSYLNEDDSKENNSSKNSQQKEQGVLAKNSQQKEQSLDSILKKLSFSCTVYDIENCLDKKRADFSLLSADTVVALDKEILGKPRDEEHAFSILKSLCGKKHRVLSSFCLVDIKRIYSYTDCTYVQFGHWSDDILKKYIATGEPMDKAGAYGIQGKGMFLVDSIAGSWHTVVGLPLVQVLELLIACEVVKAR